MPPSIILEVLQLAEAEMELRESTREAEQARSAHTDEQHTERVLPLADEQEDLLERLTGVVAEIEALPDGADFAQEVALLEGAGDAMRDAWQGLDASETGPETIAAETEAIELLLQAKRSGSGGGGGGGGSPGGGSATGQEGAVGTGLAALSLGEVGDALGAFEKPVERDVEMSAGSMRRDVPAEFRDALDAYFEAVEARLVK